MSRRSLIEPRHLVEIGATPRTAALLTKTWRDESLSSVLAWEADPRQLLVLGTPGSGKSMLAAHLAANALAGVGGWFELLKPRFSSDLRAGVRWLHPLNVDQMLRQYALEDFLIIDDLCSAAIDRLLYERYERDLSTLLTTSCSTPSELKARAGLSGTTCSRLEESRIVQLRHCDHRSSSN